MSEQRPTVRSSRLYRTWSSMKNRCYDENSTSYRWYGKRGIVVCEEWKNDYWVFYDDMIESYRPGLSLDRIDNDGPYCKANCQWSDPSQQGRNKTNNRLITYKGVTKCLVEWAEEFGLNLTTLRQRVEVMGEVKAMTESDKLRGLWRCRPGEQGEKVSRVKLTDAAVESILLLLLKKEPHKSICTTFGVSLTTVSLISRGKSRLCVRPDILRPIKRNFSSESAPTKLPRSVD